MKFNFEKAKENVKKVVLPAAVFFGGVGSLSAQDKMEMNQQTGTDKVNESIEYLSEVAVDAPVKDTYKVTKKDLDRSNIKQDAENIKQDTVILFNKLKNAGVVVDMTEEDFSKLPEDVMKDLIKHFMKKTGRISPEEFLALNKTGGTVISREDHIIREKEELEMKKKKSLEKEYTFKEFWSDQMEAIKQGKANWGDRVYWDKTGQWYVLEDSKIKADENVKYANTTSDSSINEDINEEVLASNENFREKYVPVVDHFENQK